MISVVTAVYNRKDTVAEAITSVNMQQCSSFEHIIVDGMSNDGTAEIVDACRDHHSTLIREPDQGIYDALNKGIDISKGEIIGFLHADDLLADDNALQKIEDRFVLDGADAVYGDLIYVASDDPECVIRYWKAGNYNQRKFNFGWMPPHPTVYVKKNIYRQFGVYRTDLGPSADYECLVRLMVKHRIRVSYIPEILVKMRVGGVSNSSLSNRIRANIGDRNAWLENQMKPPFGLRLTKPLSKLPQYFRRPPTRCIT